MKLNTLYLREQFNSNQLDDFLQNISDEQCFSPVLHYYLQSELSFDPDRPIYKSILNKISPEKLSIFTKEPEFLLNGICEFHSLLDIHIEKKYLLRLPFVPLNDELLERFSYEQISFPELYFIFSQNNFIKLENTHSTLNEMIYNRLISEKFDDLEISNLPSQFFDEFEIPFLENLQHLNKLGHFLLSEDKADTLDFLSVHKSMTEVSNSHFSYEFLTKNLQPVYQSIYSIHFPILFKNLPSVYKSELFVDIDLDPEFVLNKIISKGNFNDDETRSLLQEMICQP
jgi:hypothetical protein